MTIIEAINAVDELKPNTLSQMEKVRFLSMLDGKIKLEIIDTHEGGEGVNFVPYDDITPLTTVLLAPYPWDDLYIKYLEAQIDYYSGDTDRYNNSVAVYNEAYEAFSNWYNRNHMPRPTKFKFF